MRIRAVTVFGAPVEEEIRRAGALARAAREALAAAGYEVQTLRLALPPPEPSEAPEAFLARARAQEALAQEAGFDYLSVGPVGPLAPHIPRLLAETRSVFAALALSREADARAAARVIRENAAVAPDGFANLRFAALAGVPPLCPFFPAAYHDGGPMALALATEAADLAVEAARAAQDPPAACAMIQAQVEAIGRQLGALLRPIAAAFGARFAGVDFSLAPFPEPERSIGTAIEALSGVPFGASGTLAVIAGLAAALHAADFPRTGFCGVMLPVLEDAILARRAAEGAFGLPHLLLYSAVCGTGLDTVPLPGSTPEGALIRILEDLRALSERLRKPLTARLMPIPGREPGDPVRFDFAYLAPSAVLTVPDLDMR
ncbi:MAG: DUF711 family protein [Thermoflexus sp.]|jgi:uncharacterized protein (UPF0210 family)|uniref:DUF711 family protein n=1 Tax=Thermoflexus TaxID=1495649 RepID=UPI001C79A775|nr:MULTISPECIES: DUF711 family protein [Thermoflexus]MDT7885057.1 DUF711 family protein [Thermoflexus sp.]MDT7949104.1 DUF711 family protein [Thermoflexus sp.]QWK10953.1 MAG: DUF711 family protein [Thermoflexus hugenholtzii]